VAERRDGAPPALGGCLAGVKVIEVADEQGEYAGLLLGGLGADVVKVEPPDGSPTRRIGPFLDSISGPERSLFFWHYNRGKRSVSLDFDQEADRMRFRRLVTEADIVLDSTPALYLDQRDIGLASLRETSPALITARITPFGESGPWSGWKGSDLVHLALAGPMMNCGYDPLPDGTYDLAPVAPQMWHSYHITGEQLTIMIIAALIDRQSTGLGQHLSCAVHQAVSTCTELDLMSWVMRAAPLYRQTCRHAAETVSDVPTIMHTKDGRWVTARLSTKDSEKLLSFLDGYGMSGQLRAEFEQMNAAKEVEPGQVTHGRDIPGSEKAAEFDLRCREMLQRLFAKFTFDDSPWREAQDAGLLTAPLRRPEENMADPHWLTRDVFGAVEYPELGRSFSDVVAKWVSSETSWQVGRRAPMLDEDADVLSEGLGAAGAVRERDVQVTTGPAGNIQLRARTGAPRRAPGPASAFPLQGIRVFDLSWFLASSGGTRYLAALGAECLKVEWKAHPDSRIAASAMAPVGGRAARELATAPLEGVKDADMGGQFHNKNPGKRGISLNIRDPRGLEIARRLISTSDIVAEGFSPGVMDRLGLGYDALCAIKPDIIYAQQSGMGSKGTYGQFRTVGPIAAAFAGTSEMSGFEEPALPAGWGYSYLDWMGAYNFALAMVAALHFRNATGRGQWIDSSQCESGMFIAGTAFLDWSANEHQWHRYGNRSPYKPGAPHGTYRCQGADSWLAIACFTEDEWHALCRVARHPERHSDPRFGSLEARMGHQDALDDLVSGWTSGVNAFEAMSALQNAGVPAGVCQTAADRCDHDPQLRHLKWLTELPGTKIGKWPVAEVPVKMSRSRVTVGGITGRGAPCYGEDNDYVYGELLGMSKQEINDLEREGVI
jgi:crotonobetainyl-CoA:carnitine CoA-transferase CaiB-like acyl-CoA transferase